VERFLQNQDLDYFRIGVVPAAAHTVETEVVDTEAETAEAEADTVEVEAAALDSHIPSSVPHTLHVSVNSLEDYYFPMVIHRESCRPPLAA
jgi:hypothetical protein